MAGSSPGPFPIPSAFPYARPAFRRARLARVPVLPAGRRRRRVLAGCWACRRRAALAGGGGPARPGGGPATAERLRERHDLPPSRDLRREAERLDLRLHHDLGLRV